MKKPFLVLAAVLVLSAESGPQSERKFWDEKDWTQWTAYECQKILYRGPWTLGGGGLDDQYGNPQATGVELVSALPVRLARARIRQLGVAYIRPSVLYASQGTYKDGQLTLELKLEKEEPSPEYYADRVVVRYYNIGMENYFSYGDTAVLRLSDGRKIMPLETITLRKGKLEEEFEAIFPRFVNGEAIIKPGDKTLSVHIGRMKGSKFKVGWKWEFNVKDLMFQGKPEY